MKYQIIYMKNGRAITKWARSAKQAEKKSARLSAAGYTPSVWPSPTR